ncbi:MAG: hypothetical protein AAGJ37_00510 [Pseudomonadota bacterium]
MNQVFNHKVTTTPEQTRQSLLDGMGGSHEKTMVEQEQPVPVLKPSYGVGQEVDDAHHKQKLAAERMRAQRYQIRITEIHTTYRYNGRVVSTSMERKVEPMQAMGPKLANDFNMQAAQSFDMKQLGLSY